MIPTGPHRYDAGCIHGVSNGPVIVGDEMWFYYTGITTTHGGYVPEKEITIGRAAWRLDGLVSLDADDRGGVVETVLLEPAGDRLIVNANAAGGEVRVAVLDQSGRPLPGYDRGDCVPLGTDAVRHAVCWNDHDRVPRGRPLHFRFYLKRASLFSFAVQTAAPSPAEE